MDVDMGKGRISFLGITSTPVAPLLQPMPNSLSPHTCIFGIRLQGSWGGEESTTLSLHWPPTPPDTDVVQYCLTQFLCLGRGTIGLPWSQQRLQVGGSQFPLIISTLGRCSTLQAKVTLLQRILLSLTWTFPPLHSSNTSSC